MLDLLIKNALLVDGTGAPAVLGALGVQGGCIVFLGDDEGQTAQRVIDAEGRVLAPGFIDPHTHYDAQICWDPLLTSSPWHGVTTVMMGNCGVGLAPCRFDAREVLLRDLENVEGIPYQAMKAGVPFTWETHGEFLDAVEQGGLAINAGALVSLTALRYFVMGESALERSATAAEIDALCRAFRQALSTGAFGFSSDLLPHHLGYKGRPLACRHASREELRALCHVMRDLDRGTISIALASMKGGTSPISDEEVALLRLLVEESRRRVTWLPLLSHASEIDFPRHTLGKLGTLVEQAIPQITPRPMVFLVNLRKPFRFGFYPAWKPALGASPDEQLRLYQSPQFRAQAKKEMESPERPFRWENFRVIKAVRPELAHYQGQRVMDIARAQDKTPLDVLLDLAISDGLDTIFEQQNANLHPAAVEWLVRDPRLMFGLSDAGAHVDQLCDVGNSTAVLAIWVRERGAISLEEAIRRMTSMPAQLFGLPWRGQLRVGHIADLVLFDLNTVAAEPPIMVHDLPLGAARMVAHSNGVAATFVSGIQVVSDGKLTGERPGRALRSGDCEGGRRGTRP